MPNYTSRSKFNGTLNLLQAIYDCGLAKKTKFYQASTWNFMEKSKKKTIRKNTFYPKSPYATSKLFSYWITKNYRESYNMFASNGYFLIMSHQEEVRLL